MKRLYSTIDVQVQPGYVALMALQESQPAKHPLGHHSHTWKCKEPGCPVEFPILEGFGEAAVLFHRMHHTLLRMSDVIADQRDELIAKDKLIRELRGRA